MSPARLWGAWLGLLDRKEDGLPLALVRIFIGLTVLMTLLDTLGAGVAQVAWLDVEFGGYRTLTSNPWLVELLGGARPEVVWPLFWVAVVSSVLLVLGVGGRLTAFVCLQSFYGVVGLNMHAGGSYDELLSNALWLLVLAPATTTHSVDCKVRTGSWVSHEPVASWPRYLFILQLMLCYWTTGLQKVSAYWTPGGDFSALYFIFQQPSWQRVDMRWVAHVFPLTQVATLVTWLWEVSIPLWVLAYYYRLTSERDGRLRAFFLRYDVRTLYAVVGASFHLVVHFTMNVGPFSYATLAFYPALFTAVELRAAASWARSKVSRSEEARLPTP